MEFCHISLKIMHDKIAYGMSDLKKKLTLTRWSGSDSAFLQISKMIILKLSENKILEYDKITS